jgi:hypothetical protein
MNSTIPNLIALHMLIPMAGDSLIVKQAYEAGMVNITAVDWSPLAIEKLKTYIPANETTNFIASEWYSWAVQERVESYNVCFDKDSFGFCSIATRTKYVASVSRLLSSNAFVVSTW